MKATKAGGPVRVAGIELPIVDEFELEAVDTAAVEDDDEGDNGDELAEGREALDVGGIGIVIVAESLCALVVAGEETEETGATVALEAAAIDVLAEAASAEPSGIGDRLPELRRRLGDTGL